jgi:hypothetical protein
MADRTTAARRAGRTGSTANADRAGLTLVNPGSAPLTYDLDSHQLAGGESVQVDLVDRVGRAAVRTGNLLCRDPSGRWVTFERDGSVVPRPIGADDAGTDDPTTANGGDGDKIDHGDATGE